MTHKNGHVPDDRGGVPDDLIVPKEAAKLLG